MFCRGPEWSKARFSIIALAVLVVGIVSISPSKAAHDHLGLHAPCEGGPDQLLLSPLTRATDEDPDGRGRWAHRAENSDGRVVYTLLRDLLCRYPLYIIEPDITLNLNGHTIRLGLSTADLQAVFIAGPGSQVYGASRASNIELTSERPQNPEIPTTCPAEENQCLGSITGFDVGVFMDHSAGNEVSNLLVANNVNPSVDRLAPGDGILIRSSSNNEVLDNVLINNGPRSGIRVSGTVMHDGEGDDPDQDSITGTTTGTPPSPALLDPTKGGDTFTPTSVGNKISGNVVLDSPKGDEPTRAGAGIYLPPNTVGNEVVGNLVAGSGSDGISVSERYDYSLYTTNTSNSQKYGTSRVLPAASLGNTVKANAVLSNGYGGTNKEPTVGGNDGLVSVTRRKGDGIRLMTEANVDQEPFPDGESDRPANHPKSTNVLDPEDRSNRACDHLGGDENLPGVPGECEFKTRLAPVPAQTIVEDNLVCGNAGNGISAGLGQNLIRNNEVGANSPVSDVAKNLIEKSIQALPDGLLKTELERISDPTTAEPCKRNGIEDSKVYFDLNNSIISQDSSNETQQAAKDAEKSCSGNLWAGNYTRDDRIDGDRNGVADDDYALACTANGSEVDLSVTEVQTPVDGRRAGSLLSYEFTVQNKSGRSRADLVTLSHKMWYDDGTPPSGGSATCPPPEEPEDECVVELGTVGSAGSATSINLGTLATGESRKVRVQVQPDIGNVTLHNETAVEGSQPEFNATATDNVATHSASILPAELQLVMSGIPEEPTAGEPVNVTVQVLDAPTKEPATKYRGTIRFIPSDEDTISFPPPYTFTEEDGNNGAKHVFEGGVQFTRAGGASIRVEGTVEGEEEGITDSAQVDVKAGPPDAEKSTLTKSPGGPVSADGSRAANVTVRVEDRYENPVRDREISLLKTAGPGNLLINNPQETNTEGSATFAVKTTRAGSYAVKAMSGSAEVGRTDLTFVAGSVEPAKSTVRIDRPSARADGVDSATVTVKLQDEFENPAAEKHVSLSKTAGPGTPKVEPSSATTNSSGIATFTVTGTVAGKHTLQAAASEHIGEQRVIVGQVDVAFLPGAVSAARSSISASPKSIPADGSSVSRVVVTLRDQNSNAVTGKNVSLTKISGPGSPSVSPSSATTDSGGRANFSTTSTAPGKHSFRATDTTDSMDVGEIEIEFAAIRGQRDEGGDGTGADQNPSRSDSATATVAGSSARNRSPSTSGGTNRAATASGRDNNRGATGGLAAAPVTPDAAAHSGRPGGAVPQINDGIQQQDQIREANTSGGNQQRHKRSQWPLNLSLATVATLLGGAGGAWTFRWWRRRQTALLDGEFELDYEKEESGDSFPSADEASFTWRSWQQEKTVTD